MLDYQRTNRYFAQAADGIEDFAAKELAALGARNVAPIYRGAHFEADNATVYRVNYCARLISRVLAPLITFPCYSPDDLYKKAQGVDWPAVFAVERTFAVFASVAHSHITHSSYAALRLKDAIVDQFRDRVGGRPSVNAESPDIAFHLFLHKNQATISIDTSGDALHRRGYRKATLAAPMQEILAAVIIRLTEWDGSRPLYDPMCGSGTLLCEALMHACNIPSGFLRKRFGFELLPDFKPAVWSSVRRAADRDIRELREGVIAGSDAAVKAVSTAGDNLRNLPGGARVALRVTAFEKIKRIENSVIVCNPPAGIRIGVKEGIDVFTQSFGDFLKQRCKGSTAYIYFSDRALVKQIGLRTTWKKALKSGGLDGRLIKIELY